MKDSKNKLQTALTILASSVAGAMIGHKLSKGCLGCTLFLTLVGGIAGIYIDKKVQQ